MTWLWPDGRPVAVEADAAGVPVLLQWEGETHRVERVTRAWRVDEAWWRRRVWRAYYELSTDTGLLLILFQDLLTAQWYLQRVYD